MKHLHSFSITSTFTFILSILAILVIAVSAPGMVQAVLGPVASPGDIQPGNAIQASPYYEPKVNPAANFGSLSDNGTAAYIGIGIASPVSPLHILSSTSTQPETIDLTGLQPITAQWNDYCDTGGAFSGSGFLGRFARGTKASPANVQVGDRLGFNVFGGWVGSWVHSAAIEAMVDSGTVSGSSLPTYIRFLTSPNGSNSRLERMRISSGGNVGIGTTSPSHGKLDVETDNYSISAMYGYNNSSGVGIGGVSTSGVGVVGSGHHGIGVYGESLYSYAGYFNGYTYVTDNVTIGDNLTVGGRVGIGIMSPDPNTQLHVVGPNGNYSLVGYKDCGIYGRNQNSGHSGQLGGTDNGVLGTSMLGNFGYLGGPDIAVYGKHQSSSNAGWLADNGYGVYGTHGNSGNFGFLASSTYGVEGKHLASGNWGYIGGANAGVYGNNNNNSYEGTLGRWDCGVDGYSTTNFNRGQLGSSLGGVYGVSGGAGQKAGYFQGDVIVTGALTSGVKDFNIDHPQDPENKYLVHSTVESPDMKNIYDGTIVLNNIGEATVELPTYFDALNRDFRYQLTCIGGYAPIYVAEKISNNHFKISGGKPGLEVSWQVTGIRQDAYAKAHPIIVEQEKPADEKGLYLHPKEWGQPESKGIAQLHKPAGAPTLAKAE